ncbi:PaaI family thioesterase [Jiangella anatolica]|uniref:Thioesterase n=1 Tax=Jiangella anatolica TaxID=2670374 RepID=A0A2W2BWF5_9ACTN|nr:PaaI family thioesterase [Jiangella anatolica]PZF84278.1 thioesterase [Jiangella anatolica]
MTALSSAAGDAILAANFAPWVQDLGLAVVDMSESHATLRLPWSDRLAREGGALSGQALMAAADTATVLALSTALGGYRPMTTVQQSTTFQRPVVDADVLVTALVSKLGRTLAFTEVTMTADDDDRTVAQAATVYALLG